MVSEGRMRLWHWFLLFVLGTGLLACNGSGSSGFDAPHGGNTPTAAQQLENTLIITVLETQQCVENSSQEQTICPLDAPSMLTPLPHIDTDVVSPPMLL